MAGGGVTLKSVINSAQSHVYGRTDRRLLCMAAVLCKPMRIGMNRSNIESRYRKRGGVSESSISKRGGEVGAVWKHLWVSYSNSTRRNYLSLK